MTRARFTVTRDGQPIDLELVGRAEYDPETNALDVEIEEIFHRGEPWRGDLTPEESDDANTHLAEVAAVTARPALAKAPGDATGGPRRPAPTPAARRARPV